WGTDGSRSAEFLLHEYEREWSFFLSNEESGDKRVTFLWTLTAALLAGFGALATNEKMRDSRQTDMILGFGCVATGLVVVFGWQDFVRILKRNCKTDKHKIHLKR